MTERDLDREQALDAALADFDRSAEIVLERWPRMAGRAPDCHRSNSAAQAGRRGLR